MDDTGLSNCRIVGLSDCGNDPIPQSFNPSILQSNTARGLLSCRGTAARASAILAALTLAVTLSGCSLFVMAGKMFFDDPKLTCEFRRMTGVDLTKGEKKLLVLVSTPESVKGELPSLDFDLADSIYRLMKRRGVNMVNPDRVARWIDGNGGDWRHPSEVAREIDADYIAHLKIDDYRYLEENSTAAYRGHAAGSVYAYEVIKIDGTKDAQQVFVGEFRLEYPRMNPIPTDNMTPKVFQQRFLDDLSGELARRFYDYRLGETF